MREIPRKWVFQARIQDFQINKAAQAHFWRVQMNITLPIYLVSTHNNAPKVAWVIKTRGKTTAESSAWLFSIHDWTFFSVCILSSWYAKQVQHGKDWRAVLSNAHFCLNVFDFVVLL